MASAQVAVSAPNAKPHENLKSFRKVLQHSLSLSDTAWSYNIPGFPPPEATNRLGLTKSLIVKTEGLRHQILLQLQPISENRATKQDPLDSFVLVSFANFNARTLRNQSREAVGTQPATAKECTEYAVKMLRAGVTIQGLHYNFYGHSNSQLKSRTCFLFAAPKDVIRAKVAALGDFSKMKTVQKKAKRIGLLFSVAQVAMTIDPSRVEDIPDIESADGSYVFTDGCGLIAPRLAQELSRRVGIKFRDARYTPSVFQIRYRGYKGVVTVDPRMRAEAGTWLKLRKSMKKFSGGDDHSSSVVQYSKPYAFGHLNDEVILLLHSLGISSAILLQKQREHFDFFAQAVQNPILAFRFLTYVNRFDLAEKVVLGSLDEVRDQIHKLVKIEHSKMIKNEDQQRCRILIRQSRILFGVCDAWDVLQEGECHVCITHCDGQARALKNAEVLVTRNPCLHPGDLQKFRVVYKPELAHMVDAIVFSTRGKRPAADLMSGGDLDGDTFFVCWDKELIPSTVSQPAEYPGAKEPVSFNAITDDDRLVYFAKYNNGSLGRVKNLYLDWARAHGPMSPECQELNRLFSTCVDGNQIKVPPRLETAPKPPEDAPPFILDELHDNAASIIKTWQALSRDFKGSEEYSAEAIDILLSRDADDLTISEFELIQLAWRWCKKNDSQFEDVFHLFDFNLLNAEEKAWALSKVPMKVEYLRLVNNALCQSSLLQEHELYDFKLHYPGIGWKRIFSSTEDRLATFLETVAHSFELFHRKLIVYRVDERLTLAIYVPLKIEKSRECRVDGKVRLFAFPHTKGEERSSRLCLPTKINYQLYCDDNVFQLFENHRSNTWVYISRGPSNDSQYRNVVSTGDRRRARQGTIDKGVNVDFRTSVALDKFSKGLQTHIGRVNRNGVMGVEVYVISNRDTKSLRNLDLWLEYIDTQKVVPLFEQNAKGYTIETLKTVSWAEVPPHIHRIVKRDDLITLLTLDSAAQYAEVFTWLLARDQKEVLFRCFEFLLSSMVERVAFGAVPAETVMYQMMASVEQCPVLAVSFSRLDSWESLPEEVLDVVQVLAEGILLKALVLSASVVGQIMVDPFKTILSRINVLSIQAYARLAELIALTVHSPDLALDLLLEGLEKESHRLIPHRPAIIRHAVKNLVGIAIDHVGEAAEQSRTREDLLDLKLVPESEDGYTVVEAEFRIDSRGGTPEKSAHVRLIAASPPSNSLMGRVCSVDALVISSSPGSAKFKCFHPMPEFVERCSWKLQYCGPFVTTKTMFESVLNLALSPESCCEIYGPIMGIRDENTESGLFLEPSEIFYARLGELNESQNAAVFSALRWPLTCLWGPPGTGKTHTIVEIIKQIQRHHKGIRLLVTAPTHNAVDNVMRRYLKDVEQNMASPLRVSTEVRKVASDIGKYTVDAMAGQEIYASHQAMRKAQEMVARSRLIFTTCIGAGLGLLRSQSFEVVIVDEASQQTEPASLVPLTKGCRKAILVGDHVQLRPTVTPHAALQEFDVSLFERLHIQKRDDDKTSSDLNDDETLSHHGVSRVMLDTQYRMHRDICSFSSGEFYGGKLKTGVLDAARPMFSSQFPWPPKSRMVFVECGEREEMWQKSKFNKGQAKLCAEICELLSSAEPPLKAQEEATAPKPFSEANKLAAAKGALLAPIPRELEKKPAQPSAQTTTTNTFSIAVLTPYTKQVELLKQTLSKFSQVEVCSIDGFQGREADIVVFVTVRCNEHHDIGFLKDMRRLNVALTRAKTGVIVIGNKATLTLGTADPESAAVWKRLLECLEEVRLEEQPRIAKNSRKE